MRAAWAARTSYGRLLALLAAASGELASAEDALADAFERALTIWPRDGTPDNPDAWLLTVARNRLRDGWRSAATRTSVPLEPARHAPVHLDDVDPDAVGDRRLELLLVCAHPAIDAGVRTPLMLNTVLGYTAAQIAAAFALPAPTLAARLVRAKRRIRAARIPFRIPDRTALPGRLADVLEAIYGAYAIDWRVGSPQPSPGLVHEALYLAETVARLVPTEPEAPGLAALICLSAARAPARTDAQGHLVPLPEQDPARWDHDLVDRGRRHLRAAHALGRVGRFQLEAAVQAVHCARVETGRTDWTTLLELHRHLHALAPTLGATTALAAVTAEVDGPAAGLAVLDRLGEEASRFQPAWATRADLLRRLHRPTEAAVAYGEAVALTADPAERAHLERLRDSVVVAPGASGA